ncbi:MAG: DUF554 domain-containing protein [Tetragenococcus sp.]|nr:DUF554 domain-containing protein [Tetragenococcus sp.]
MPYGVIINSSSVLIGGIIGTLVGKYLSAEFKTQITYVFGLCSMAMGIFTLDEMQNMPAVVFAVVLGTGIGLVFKLGKWIDKAGMTMQKPVGSIFKNNFEHGMTNDEYISLLVTAIVLFCASGTGIYGALDAGMTGDHTILLSKSILDLFTAAIFAANIGYVISVIAVPQFIILILLFMLAQVIIPMTTPDMVADFRAAGAFLMIATGFRMVKLIEFPIADMIPAMVLAMPFSYLWTTWIIPLLN